MISLPFNAFDIIINSNTYEKIPLSQDEHFLQDTESFMFPESATCGERDFVAINISCTKAKPLRGNN